MHLKTNKNFARNALFFAKKTIKFSGKRSQQLPDLTSYPSAPPHSKILDPPLMSSGSPIHRRRPQQHQNNLLLFSAACSDEHESFCVTWLQRRFQKANSSTKTPSGRKVGVLRTESPTDRHSTQDRTPPPLPPG